MKIYIIILHRTKEEEKREQRRESRMRRTYTSDGEVSLVLGCLATDR